MKTKKFKARLVLNLDIEATCMEVAKSLVDDYMNAETIYCQWPDGEFGSAKLNQYEQVVDICELS